MKRIASTTITIDKISNQLLENEIYENLREKFQLMVQKIDINGVDRYTFKNVTVKIYFNFYIKEDNNRLVVNVYKGHINEIYNTKDNQYKAHSNVWFMNGWLDKSIIETGIEILYFEKKESLDTIFKKIEEQYIKEKHYRLYILNPEYLLNQLEDNPKDIY